MKTDKLPRPFINMRISQDRKNLYKRVAKNKGLTLTAWIIVTLNQAVREYANETKKAAKV